MQHSTAKKSLSVLLSLLMLLSLFGVSAFAYDAPAGYEQVTVTDSYEAPADLADGDLYFVGYSFVYDDDLTLPEVYFNETEGSLIIVPLNEEAITASLANESDVDDYFCYLFKVGFEPAADAYADEGYILLVEGAENANEGYYLNPVGGGFEGWFSGRS